MAKPRWKWSSTTVSQLTPREAARVDAYRTKYLNEAKRALTEWMDSEGFAEVYTEEVPGELRWAWERLWDNQYSVGIISMELKFTYRRRPYWLTR